MKRNFSFKQHALKLALVSAFALGAATVGVNSYAVDGTASATATVVTPLTIGTITNLRFGSFSTSASGQTVIIAGDSTGGRSGSATLLNSTSGSAAFPISGTAGQTYSITIPTSAVTIKIGTSVVAAENMSVASFTSTPAAGTGTGLLNSSGTQTVYVGATVTTVAGQVAGIYSGNFTVSLNYN